MDAIKQIYEIGLDLATNTKHTKWLSPALLGLDALLTGLIIWKVPYTEIDWTAYMQQISQYVSGEKDYTKLYGGTGPLVYPAAHVYTYQVLYWVTNKGQDVLRAQAIFAVLYLSALAVVLQVYRGAKVPPYVFPMLVLSKRLHSIFVLRLFNDGFAVLWLWLAIYFYQRRAPTLGSIVYSWGLGTKMSLLLSLPAFGVILFLTRGVQTGLKQLWQMVQVQIVISFPFIPANAIGYLSRSFEFSRVFLFKWTVNWRFVGEETFLSKEFSVALLVGHVSTLAFFVLTRWLRPTGKSVGELVSKALKFEEPLGDVQHQVAKKVTRQFVVTTVLTANVIGMLFARSLHYQFYAYLAWSTPFLLWKSGMHPIFQYALWAAQEWAWNVYPSTDLSSKVVVGVMAITVAGVWWGTGTEDHPEETKETQPNSRWYIK